MKTSILTLLLVAYPLAPAGSLRHLLSEQEDLLEEQDTEDNNEENVLETLDPELQQGDLGSQHDEPLSLHQQDQEHRALASRVVKSTSGTAYSGYKWARWSGNYLFARYPALKKFRFNDRYGDRPVDKIGVKTWRTGAQMWYSDQQAEDHFYYNIQGVDLPAGTTYKSVSGRFNGRGGGCAYRSVFLSAPRCSGTPVLRGFLLNYDYERHVNMVSVSLYKDQKFDHCEVRVSACMTDFNNDDPFDFTVDYAIVPDGHVEASGTISDTDSGGSDSDMHMNVCSGACQGQAVLTGFKLDLNRAWHGEVDMPLDVIEVGVSVLYDDVKAYVSYDDRRNDDGYSWWVTYAVIK